MQADVGANYTNSDSTSIGRMESNPLEVSAEQVQKLSQIAFKCFLIISEDEEDAI